MFKEGFSKYRKVYAHLWQTYGQDWHVRVSFFVRFLTRICKLVALPIAASQIIASIAKQDFARAKLMVLIYAVFSLVLGLLTPLTKYIALKGENVLYSKTTTEYFTKLVETDLSYFNDNLTGYLTTATRQYVDNQLELLRSLRDKYMNTLLSIALPVVVIFWVDHVLGLAALCLSAVQAVYLLWASQVVAPYRTKSREYYKRISGYIADSISNIVALKAASQEKAKSRAVGVLMKQESEVFVAKYEAQAKMILFRELLTVSIFAILFWLTVTRISGGSISIGGAVLVIGYAATILTGTYELSDVLEEHDEYVDKIMPAFEVLERTNIVKDPKRPIKLKKPRGELELKNVSFIYQESDGATAVFSNLSLKIPAGQKVGVVGVSGAGKSTLAKLLLRFNDPTEGVVTIDGIDAKKIRQAELRSAIAYVPQEPLLFHTTVRENISLTLPNATSKQVTDAARAAHALEFIQNLPNGMESVVGERGVKLSGGQKQRIAIARAVLQKAPIIVLDEATSALDSESEQIIKDSFKTILKGKTAVVVAHRLSTLSDMDRIILIDRGVIAEDGSHAELIAKGGLYAKLWQRQQMHRDEPTV